MPLLAYDCGSTALGETRVGVVSVDMALEGTAASIVMRGRME